MSTTAPSPSLLAPLPFLPSALRDRLQRAAQSGLSDREKVIAAAAAEAILPRGRSHEAGGFGTADRLDHIAQEMGRLYTQGCKTLLWTLELSTLATHRRLFSALPVEARYAHLKSWSFHESKAVANIARAILLPLRFAHYDSPTFYEQVNVKFRHPTPLLTEVDRWKRQMTDGATAGEDVDLECEFVVVGSGAGGAAVAYDLARRGRAVLIVEEGRYFDRRHFDGRPPRAFRDMYRDRGLTIALGNVGMPVWSGRAVGGSTVVNSGTCYRAPERTFARWRRAYGLSQFSSSSMSPYYDAVEQMLDVGYPDPKYLGGVARVIARGATRLGFKHGPVRRNAPGCDGAGVCVLGCPTGAKRSTDVSYIPRALEHGAQLVSNATVETIEVKDGRARGVTARLASGRTLRVKAEAVIVAGGALMTPLLLRKNGLCTESGWLGRNLSIHPASKVVAQFDEVIDMVTSAIPQSYSIEEFADEGIMLEGGSVPPSAAALGMWSIGEDFVRLMDDYRHLALFGFMIQDRSRGRVLPGRKGSPLVLYSLNEPDTRRMQRGIEILVEVFLAAGARRVFPFVRGQYEISSHHDLDRLRKRSLRPGDFEVTSYHPLGTCRIGADPKRSCLRPDHRAWHVTGLYVVDGSAIPSSLGVNPQLTIMAMALRAAEIIDQAIA